MQRSSFTLIELLVVIAILAVLSVAVVFIINPADIIKQSRDTNRLTDLNNLNKALAVFDVTNPNDFTGTSSIVYTSLPDSTTTCANLSLPALPAGYTYNCVTSSTLTQADGTGWIPVNFTNVSYGSPVQRLPIDPVNTTTSGNYYTYNMGGSWELTAQLESVKNRNGGSGDRVSNDGGDSFGLLEIGSNLGLSPIQEKRGLILYLALNEGSGVTAADSSGSGNNGTITTGAGGWTTDNRGGNRAYEFDGANTKITLGSTVSTPSTFSFWIKPNSQSVGYGGIFTNPGAVGYYYAGSTKGVDAGKINYYNSIDHYSSSTITNNSWTHIAVTLNGTTFSFYFNGVFINTISSSASALSVLGTDSGNDFKGSLSDVRAYNRVLSLAEIKSIYDSTK